MTQHATTPIRPACRRATFRRRTTSPCSWRRRRSIRRSATLDHAGSHYVEVQPTGQILGFNNTNELVKNAEWDIQLSEDRLHPRSRQVPRDAGDDRQPAVRDRAARFRSASTRASATPSASGIGSRPGETLPARPTPRPAVEGAQGAKPRASASRGRSRRQQARLTSRRLDVGRPRSRLTPLAPRFTYYLRGGAARTAPSRARASSR